MSFGGWSIDYELFSWMKANIEDGKTVLEIGSGQSTANLINHWNIISIEEDINWCNRYHNRYIHAPIVNGWYDMEKISESLTFDIDVILIDGPAYGERKYMINHIDFFLERNPKILIFDDTDREKDLSLFNEVVQYLKNTNKEIEYEHVKFNKMFSYIKIK